MTVYETDVPGVGRKFELEVGDESRLVVLLHHDGRRELFVRERPEADSERVADLTGEQARKLGAVLGGAYFQPVEFSNTSVPLGDAIIEWVTIPEGSPVEDVTLADSNLRDATGASVIAVQRGPDTIANPDADTTLNAGDVLVALGTRDEHAELESFVTAA
ncbi:cation:proton antiporter regulatory subunit [Halorubellus litoreus]|uniref:Cation:proton antiporter regulatory subunit n=1 Tax=Halorubellus litoreus TaxID=755308 RepID=A0ABD5VMP3_9EURY